MSFEISIHQISLGDQINGDWTYRTHRKDKKNAYKIVIGKLEGK